MKGIKCRVYLLSVKVIHEKFPDEHKKYQGKKKPVPDRIHVHLKKGQAPINKEDENAHETITITLRKSSTANFAWVWCKILTYCFLNLNCKLELGFGFRYMISFPFLFPLHYVIHPWVSQFFYTEKESKN